MKNLLVVEDSKTIANILKLLFTKKGYTIEHTSEGKKVNKIVKENPIHLVILDLMMPEVSGKEVLLNLKNDPDTKDVPVIILTAKIDALKWDKELEICDAFMTKPFKNDELVQKVNELLTK